MIRYRVVKPGLISSGWVGEYVAHFDGDRIILKFANGRELKYMKSSVERLSNKPEVVESWIVVKDKALGLDRPKQYKQHESEESARNEAIRLARANPGHAFAYYKRCSTVEYKRVTTHELVETK